MNTSIKVSKIKEGEDTRKSSSLIGTVDFLTYHDLEALFGKPDYLDDCGDKISCEWNRAFSDGKRTFYVDIYDYKATKAYDSRNTAKTYKEVTEWHFGSDTEEAGELVRAYIGAYVIAQAAQIQH